MGKIPEIDQVPLCLMEDSLLNSHFHFDDFCLEIAVYFLFTFFNQFLDILLLEYEGEPFLIREFEQIGIVVEEIL